MKIPQIRKEPLVWCHGENEAESIRGPQVEPENLTIKEEIETKPGNTLWAPDQAAPEGYPTQSLKSDVNQKIPILA